MRAEPSTGSERIGRLAAGYPFEVHGTAEGPGCATWGALAPRGWACLERAAPTDRPVAALPALMDYQPPDPRDFERYLAGGSFARPDGDPVLPFAYGRVWRGWKAPVYASARAWAEGEAPVGKLPTGLRARFVAAEVTPRGVALVLPDGRAVPEQGVYVFPVTRFQGRDLRVDPLEEGWLPAWVVRYAGLDAEGPEGPVHLPYHAPLAVRAEPEDGRWTAVWEGQTLQLPVGPDVRVWRPSARPPGVGEAERWIDVDPAQQTLGVLDGDALIYATLVSTGQRGTPTPSGVFRIGDKAAWGDMRSLPGAADSYFVEAVPWILHFKPRYALHGAYWHWGFGHPASHGCINLAPRDAAWIFDAVAPVLPAGWHSVWAVDEDPGAVLRVR